MFDIRDIEYYPKPEKHKVVAIIRNVQFDAVEELYRKAGMPNLFMPNAKQLMMPDILKATAYCHPSDEFDEEKGKKIAKKRLIKMYNNTKASTINQFLRKLQIFMDKSNELAKVSSERASKIQVYED